MGILGVRAVWPKLALILSLSLMTMVFLAGSGHAQQATPPDAAQQKIDQLVKLLDDPEIRALLASKSKEQAPPAMADMSATEFTVWLNSVQDHLRSVGNAIPLVPDEFERAGETTMAGINGRSPTAVFFLFVLLVAIGLAAEWIFGRIARRIQARKIGLHPTEGAPAAGGFHAIGRYMFIGIAPLVVFGIASVGLFLTLDWPALLSRLIVPTLLGLIAGRLVIRTSKILLLPYPKGREEGAVRLIPVDDQAAVFWFTRVVVVTGIFFLGWAAGGVMTALGVLQPVKAVVVYGIGIALLAAAIEIVWNRPRPAGHMSRHGVFDWVLTFWLCVLWILWVAGLPVALWLGIYALLLPSALRIASSVIHNAYSRQREAVPGNSPIFEVLIERGVRAAIIVLAVLWLATVLRLHPTAMTQDALASRISRGLLSGVVVLLAADMLWEMAKAFINLRLDRARAANGDEAELARSGRLQTLLPILRNFLAVLIGAIAIMMVLSGLGVEVGPLIAGAGIFGVAIGFGSQTLVKDVISGIFYMMDDAFRVGEYIQSGSYKGTVESFSIRSVKLRHHRGPIFTVPFGSLGAVQNMSRDWVIDKFLISVSYQTDIAVVRKLVKGVGATLLEDPELGPMIIETVKMKGVEQFGDYGINLSFAMMTKPGHQSTIRRRAYAMIREAFIANGIDFASPTVQVANDEHGAAKVAAAATNNAIAAKKTAAENAENVDGG